MRDRLRDYQSELLERVEQALRVPTARIMLQLPTGGGKTHIAAELLARRLNGGRKSVWLTHRKELARQTQGLLQGADLAATANMLWDFRTDIDAPVIPNGVVILMAQTVSRRNARANVWGGYNANDLLVIDEAHHATAEGWERAITQWPGPVLGMTATPWRLSEREGFDHLFGELYSGPQVSALQSSRWLCPARVLLPPEEQRVQEGQVDYTGDYSDSSIERANEEREVWTAGAFRFWKRHCADRQTVVYAVSVGHAHSLARVFREAGVRTGLLLGDTPDDERAMWIRQFQDGTTKVLINVAVATEGFDLPDASCVLMTRPTMSLALYLQMVGRGLRPKEDGGDCIILDLAGNSLRHGLPEANRDWSLQARGGPPPGGQPPVVRCAECESVSPAASHNCIGCGAPFGETCKRCGAWRAWKRWSKKNECDRSHDLVCDLCHYDAHIRARLPVTDELKELAMLQHDDELPADRDPFLKNLLEEERRRIVSSAEERKGELRYLVNTRKAELADDDELDRLFENHLDGLQAEERPETRPQERRLFTEWESGLKQELTEWSQELAVLESQAVDIQLVFHTARERLLRLFEAEARETGLLPQGRTGEASPGILPTGARQPCLCGCGQYPKGRHSRYMPGHDARHSSQMLRLGRFEETGTEWLTFVRLSEWGRAEAQQEGRLTTPLSLRDPTGKEARVNNWADLLVETAEWLIREGLLTRERQTVRLRRATKKYLIHVAPDHPSGRAFNNRKQLSNGLYMDLQWSSKAIARICAQLVNEFGQDPEEFNVLLQKYVV